MSSSALRAAWDAAQSSPSSPPSGGGLHAAWESAQGNNDIHAEYASGRLAKRVQRENTNDKEMADAETPSYAQQALGGVASLARDIPGAEALQSGARALVRGQSYRDARSDIRGAEESAPAAVRVGNRLIGGTVAAMALPIKSPTLSGAAYGALSGALESDPDAGIADRMKGAAIGGATGAVTGKLADAGTNLIRSKLTPTLGKQALTRNDAMQSADRTNFGRAETEAATAGGTSSGIQAALQESDIKPFADAVRNSRSMAGASDATILREAHKLMSERQGILNNRVINTDDFKAGSQLEMRDLGAAKERLLQAADVPMPSLRPAVETHATFKGEENAMREGSRATKTLLSGKQAGEKNLLKRSAEAFTNDAVPKMTPDEASASLGGVLGRTQDLTHLKANPLKGFGIPGALHNAGKITPFVQQLEQQMGGAPIPVDILRAIAASQGHPTP